MDEKRFDWKESTFVRHYGIDFRKEWTIESHGINKDAFAIIAGSVNNLSKTWQDKERAFLKALRSEMKVDWRKKQRTSSATRTMSKRKRAGSRRWPVS